MSGKAKLQAGTHGPAVIEGPATALSWLTVLPVRGGARAFDRITGARVIANLPVVGLVVGGVAAGVRWGLDALGTSGMLAGVLVVIACQLVTRFMHMDGLADVADALGSYAAPEKAREILADPHAGLIGMGSALLALLAQAAAMTSLPWQLVFFVPVVGRICGIVVAWRGFQPMRPNGFGAMIIGTASAWWVMAWCVVVVPLMLLVDVPWWRPVSGLLVAIVVAVVLARHCHRRFAGLNGDTCGFVIEVTATVFACWMVL